MDHLIARITENLIARVTGPMKFRIFLQPAMATFFAIRDGLKDARQGKPAYFWALFTDKEEREQMLRDGWKGVGKVFILAIVLDVAGGIEQCVQPLLDAPMTSHQVLDGCVDCRGG